MNAWWIALQFLTRLPVSLSAMPEPQQVGRSLLFYPAVGLLIGGLLWAVQALTEGAPLLLQGALILTLWVAVTGALHLDGLADSADAWVGGLGDVERTLRIMKDPASGPIAVVSLVLLLLLKFAAIVAILDAGHGVYLLLAPWLARVLLPLLLLITPYLRAGGLGAALVEYMPHTALRRVIGLNLLAVLLFGWTGGMVLMVGLGVFFYLRRLMLQRLGGCTGDTAGALVEISECAIVLTLAL
ncbi:adenosylcobinamide-GDP ribazoletransferase [Pseudomonas sp. TTU2014-080ASC]|uniref:adenosylcobinamide-GDP ribazoletransferase n=1 Tax=Pseudomonas sp. TTU2014-080ASC TaxID=1729724 RepID=UPI0007184DA7|nr:adenosylcobinamide-GDP ribazoletransferase [Pseudomonas sp. TTU2014-080ASC]KRW58057.1 cobalamin synthase [Pseudomonas sp. TTU2014-080ASC]